MSDTTDAVKHSHPAHAVKHGASTEAVKHILPEADARRMAHLSAQIATLLYEMSEIFAGAAAVKHDSLEPRYVPSSPAEADADVTYIEIVRGPAGTGCYVTTSDGTSWCEYPCGG
ncbi:hypothetical protein AB0M28_22825 [Streptomyces sp. NPDC051940]|uniref:hypothetical protein n=1 Tax=Streptomyces sp. NPDC051940 TaxID=3155675 RepID=UPI0034434F47